MKRILVTGGARGIGRAIVEKLADAGHQITATYSNSEKSANELSDKFSNVKFVKVDLTNREELLSFVDQMNDEEFDVLINNAGLWLGKVFEKNNPEEIFEQYDLNLTAPTVLTNGLLPALQKSNNPLVIFISSQAAHPTFPGEAVYSASKAGISTLAAVLRGELNRKGIRLTAVEPWGVNTYGVEEPSGMVVPSDLAGIISYLIELPSEIQIDTLNVSNIKQTRGDFPEWIEK